MKSKKRRRGRVYRRNYNYFSRFFLIGVLLMRFASQTSDKEAELLCQNSIAIRARNAVTIGGDAAELQAKLIPLCAMTIDKKVSGDRERDTAADSR